MATEVYDIKNIATNLEVHLDPIRDPLGTP